MDCVTSKKPERNQSNLILPVQIPRIMSLILPGNKFVNGGSERMANKHMGIKLLGHKVAGLESEIIEMEYLQLPENMR